MADDLSDFPIMSDPEFEIPDSFEDWSSAELNLDDSFSWGSVWDAITSPTARTLLNLGSGLYGLYESGQQRNMARDAIRASDPFGPYRQQYAQQLMALIADPSSITKDPGYKFQFDQGAEAVRRAMASKGFIQSGNEGIALTEYGQNFAQKAYNDKITQLAGLAGAGISPNPGPGLNAYNQGLETASAALASLGYGITRGGSSAGTPGASRPNSAGGEAATVGAGLSAVSAGARLAGLAGVGNETTSAIGSTAGSLGQIVTGLDKGGVGGYGQAVTGAASLAGYDTAGWGGIISAGANVIEGDYGSAGMDLAGVAMGSPLVAIGNAIASYANHAFLGDFSKDRNTAAFKQFTGAKNAVIPLGKAGLNMMVIPKADGSYTLVNTPQWNDLAGSWYGAAVGPDGNQADWAAKFQDFSSRYLNQPASLPFGFTFDTATGNIMSGDTIRWDYSKAGG